MNTIQANRHHEGIVVLYGLSPTGMWAGRDSGFGGKFRRKAAQGTDVLGVGDEHSREVLGWSAAFR